MRLKRQLLLYLLSEVEWLEELLEQLPLLLGYEHWEMPPEQVHEVSQVDGQKGEVVQKDVDGAH